MCNESTVLVPLTQGKFAIIDEADAEEILRHKWQVDRGYAKRTRKLSDEPGPGKVLMHVAIFGETNGLEIDHINRDKLDNRRKNLRLANRTQNLANAGMSSRNTSGFRGVSWARNAGKWHAYIKIDGKRKHIGLYTSLEGAARAYDAAAKEAFEEFAFLNFPE